MYTEENEQQSHFHWNKLERTPVSPALFRLYFGDQLWREIGSAIIRKETTLEEIVRGAISREEIEERIFQQELKGAFSFLIHQLSKRAMTEYDVQKLLKRHRVSEKAIQETLFNVVQKGYVSDATMLESLSRKFLNQKKSMKHIAMKLKHRFGKEVEIPILNEEGGETPSVLQDTKTLESLIQKKFLKQLIEAKNDRKAFHNLIAKLCRKGFSYDLVIDALNKVQENGFILQSMQDE